MGRGKKVLIGIVGVFALLIIIAAGSSPSPTRESQQAAPVPAAPVPAPQPAPPPQPQAPPIPEAKRGVFIQGVTTRTNEYGWYVLTGEVKNNKTGVARFVQVIVTFYDADKKVVGTKYTFTEPNNINPGETAPFKITVTELDIVPKIVDYKLTIDAR